MSDDVGFDPDEVRGLMSAPKTCCAFQQLVRRPGCMPMRSWHVHVHAQVDEEGLPLVYNEDKIRQFWQNKCVNMLLPLLKPHRRPCQCMLNQGFDVAAGGVSWQRDGLHLQPSQVLILK